MTFRVLLDGTRRVINRSIVRLANVGENNLRADTAAGVIPKREYIRAAERTCLPTLDVSSSPFVVGDTVLGAFKFGDPTSNPVVDPPNQPSPHSPGSSLQTRINAKRKDAQRDRERHRSSTNQRESSQKGEQVIGEPTTGTPFA